MLLSTLSLSDCMSLFARTPLLGQSGLKSRNRCSAVRPTILPTGPPPTVVTECWVEGCCFEQRMLSPLEHLVFQPLPAPMPIPGQHNILDCENLADLYIGATKFLVHLSGFSTGEMVYLKRLLRAIGMSLSFSSFYLE